MTSGNDGWDRFDWDSWGDAPSADGRNGASEPSRPDGENDRLTGIEDEEAPAQGRWVSQGGVIQWEEPDDMDSETPDAHREAASPWAADDLTLPLGAPSATRVRGVRAWLLRQWMLENEAMGVILLERRRRTEREDEEERPSRPSIAARDDSPLELALLEHQAAATEYETLLAALDDHVAHTGPDRVLIEYHFWLNEQLAALAAAAEAPAGFGEHYLYAPIETPAGAPHPTPRSGAEWEGRATAVIQTRRRVERMTAPEEEE